MRWALYSGAALAFVFLIVRLWRDGYEFLSIDDLVSAVSIVAATLFVPGALDMISKAFSSDELPILNAAEQRVALIVGGSLLLLTAATTVFNYFRNAFLRRS